MIYDFQRMRFAANGSKSNDRMLWMSIVEEAKACSAV